MATNFPTSLDSFTNPTSGSALNSPSHAGQHADINDAMEAVQTKLGTGAGTLGVLSNFTPNFYPGAGTWTTVFGYSAYYYQLKNIVYGFGRLYIGNAGTGSTGVHFSLPVTADTGILGIGNGRDTALTGNQFHVYLVNNTIAALRFYNNADTANNAYDLHFTFMYKAA